MTDDSVEVLLAYWAEHRTQLRQSEDQRAVLTNYILVVTAALGGLVVQQRIDVRTIPLSLLVAGIGLYGALAVAKYHERAEYHLIQARVLTRVLRDLGALPDNSAVLDDSRHQHYRKYPRLHRIRLHYIWTGLHLGIALFGVILALIPPVRAVT